MTTNCTLAAAALAALLIAPAAQALSTGPVSTDNDEFFILDTFGVTELSGFGEFDDGPLAGEQYDFIYDFGDLADPTDDDASLFLTEFSVTGMLTADDGDALTFLFTDFGGGAFPLGLEFVVSGFGFSRPVLDEFAALIASDNDFTGNLSASAAAVVPLPAAGWMLIAGLGALLAAGGRRRT